MSVYLHKPTPPSMPGLRALKGRREDIHLEIKQELPNGREIRKQHGIAHNHTDEKQRGAAKKKLKEVEREAKWSIARSVASLMNGLGGDFILGGVEAPADAEGKDTVIGLSDAWAQFPGRWTEQKLEGALRDLLHPDSADLYWRLHRVTFEDDALGTIESFVVHVEPYPSGLVAVKSPTGDAYTFPVRVDDGTKYLNPTEATERMFPKRRDTFLTLSRAMNHALQEAQLPPVSLPGGVSIAVRGHIGQRVNIPNPSMKLAELKEVTDRDLTLAFSAERIHQLARWGQQQCETDAHVEALVRVPLDLVRTVWMLKSRDEDGAPEQVVQLLVEGVVALLAVPETKGFTVAYYP